MNTLKTLSLLLLFTIGCDSILGFGEKFGYDYKSIKYLQSTNIGGFKVWYQERGGDSAFLGLDLKTRGVWVVEDEEFKKYSYTTSCWYDWHIKKITDSYIEVGVRER
jgi:hypothetical protein